MTRQELIEYLGQCKLVEGHNIGELHFNRGINLAIKVISEELEPTISEVKEYCEKEISKDCLECKLIDYCDLLPVHWDIKEITKAIRAEKDTK